MSVFSVENPHDGGTFENYTRFEWGVEVGVVTTFMLRPFVPHEFDMNIVENRTSALTRKKLLQAEIKTRFCQVITKNEKVFCRKRSASL